MTLLIIQDGEMLVRGLRCESELYVDKLFVQILLVFELFELFELFEILNLFRNV